MAAKISIVRAAKVKGEESSLSFSSTSKMLFDALVILGSLSVQFLGVIMNAGIVWYGASLPEARRTLVNRLTSNQCMVCIAFDVVILNSVVVVRAMGRLPELVCDCMHMSFISLTVAYFLYADIMIVIRFLYICVFKNAGMFNDNFLHLFFTVLLTILPVYFSLLLRLIGNHKGPFWYACADRLKPEDEGLGSLEPVFYIGVASLVLHLVLFWVIFREERKMELADHQGHEHHASNGSKFNQVR